MAKSFKVFKNNLIEILKRPEMTVLPGHLAFFFVLSIVPILTIISYFASIFHISLSDLAAYFNLNINSGIMELLTPIISNESTRFGLIILFIVGIYIISNGTNSIIVAANNIYGIDQKTFLQRRIKAIMMVFILIMLFIFILLVPILGNFILSLIEKVSGYSEVYNIINIFKMPFSWFIIFIFIKILYTIAPDKQIPSSYVNIGSLFTSVGWIIATEIYTYYVGHIANYNFYYSSLTNIAILMIWMYILSTIFVIGLAINYKEEPYVEEKTRELKRINNAKNRENKK